LFLPGDLLDLTAEPPLFAGLVGRHRLGPELVTVAAKGLEIDGSDLDRPPAAIPGFVGEVGFSVGRSGEETLSGEVLGPPTIARAIVVRGSGHEGFDALDLAAPEGAQLCQLVQPLASEILGAVLGAKVADLVSEPVQVRHQGTQRRRLAGTLRSF